MPLPKLKTLCHLKQYFCKSTGFFCLNLNPGIAGKFWRAFHIYVSNLSYSSSRKVASKVCQDILGDPEPQKSGVYG